MQFTPPQYCSPCLDPCQAKVVGSDQVGYTGPNLPCTAIHTCDSLSVALQKIDEQICELKNTVVSLQHQINSLTTTTTTTIAPTTTTTTTGIAPTTTTTTTVITECLKYSIVIPEGGTGGILGISCSGEVIDVGGLTGPLETDTCARTLAGTGDTVVAVVNSCDNPCVEYTIIVPDGGNATISGVDCDGNPFSGLPLTGPINAPYCFRSVSGVGDINISITGACDTP